MELARKHFFRFKRASRTAANASHENYSWGMNFGAMELNTFIHDLEQQWMANQTHGPVRDWDKRPFHCIQIRK
jgi:hypothetical protein